MAVMLVGEIIGGYIYLSSHFENLQAASLGTGRSGSSSTIIGIILSFVTGGCAVLFVTSERQWCTVYDHMCLIVFSLVTVAFQILATYINARESAKEVMQNRVLATHANQNIENLRELLGKPMFEAQQP